MVRVCPCCSTALADDAASCYVCGATIARPATMLHASRRVVTGPTMRLAPLHEHAALPRPTQRARDTREICVGAVGLVFAFTFVLGYANALATLGLSALSLGALLIPLIGGMFAEAAWMQGRWWRGWWGMLLWQAVIWSIALVRMLL